MKYLLICAIAQIRKYYRDREAESMKPDRALRICRTSWGCFNLYLARRPSVSYLTTSASPKAASTWLTLETLRPTAPARALGLISLFLAKTWTIANARGLPRTRHKRDCR